MIILHLIAQVALQSVSIVKLMVCHILIVKPNQVHKHNHQEVWEELNLCICFEKE